MSWCGGGEMSDTPGCVCRSRAISADTLWPGSWPPSPGLDPCAILIWSSSAHERYSGVTPKRPDATCLILQLRSRLAPLVRYRYGSSPPSPVLDAPPIMLNAIASVSCASREMAPCEIARGHLPRG